MRANSWTIPVKAGWVVTSWTFSPSSQTSRPSLRLSMYRAPVMAPSAVVVSNPMPCLLPGERYGPIIQPRSAQTTTQSDGESCHDYTPAVQRMGAVPNIANLGGCARPARLDSAHACTPWGSSHLCARGVPGPSFGWKDKLPDPESAGMRILAFRRERSIDPANPLRDILHMDALDVRQIFLEGADQGFRQHGDPIFRAFAIPNDDLTLGKVQVFDA